MLEGHWDEVEWGKEDVPLNPNLATYEMAAKHGAVSFFSMRDEGELVGYAVFWTHGHPHHDGKIFAINDLLYVKPEYRRSALVDGFLMFCEQELVLIGCDVMTVSMKTNHDHPGLMGIHGFTATEKIYSKVIK
jgi:hypothetical protein